MSYPEFNIGEMLRFRSEKRNFIHEAKAVVLKGQSPLKQARPVFQHVLTCFALSARRL